MANPNNSFATRANHVAQEPDPSTGAVTLPISLATTFAQVSPGVHRGYDYSRVSNPTRNAFEKLLANLENGLYCSAFASGCAATVNVLNMLSSGDHVICVDDVYGGTNRYFNKVASVAMNLSFDFTDLSSNFEDLFKPNTKLVWLETPTNPTLKITDIKHVAEITHRHNCLLVVDNTFMSPYLQNPLDLGADIVVHSVTKYINGHSDVVMGAMVTNSEAVRDKMAFLQKSLGAVPSPFDCYLAIRGIKTLALRMEKHGENAMAVAKFLEAHPKVERVYYPGLPSHPQHHIAKKQQKGFGGMVTIILKGGVKESRAFLENLELFALAESLGAVESLAEHPAIMTHASLSADQRRKLGISDSLVRLSVGIEDKNDLIADLAKALDSVHLASRM